MPRSATGAFVLVAAPMGHYGSGITATTFRLRRRRSSGRRGGSWGSVSRGLACFYAGALSGITVQHGWQVTVSQQFAERQQCSLEADTPKILRECGQPRRHSRAMLRGMSSTAKTGKQPTDTASSSRGSQILRSVCALTGEKWHKRMRSLSMSKSNVADVSAKP